MTTTTPLDIKVVFDATSRRRSGGVRPSLPHSRHQGSRAWAVVALMNIVVASAMYYAIWWKADPEIYLRLTLKTPVAMDLDMAAGIFVRQPKSTTPRVAPSPVVAETSSEFSPATAQWLIPTTAYSWLTLATVATCVLALGAGAAAVRAGGPHWRTFGWIASLMLIVALAAGAFIVWREYGIAYKPRHLRLGMGGLVLLASALGLVVGRGARRACRFGAFLVVLAAAGTAVGLYLGNKTGAIEAQYATAGVLATAFAAHSAYGWLLLAVVWRIAR